MASGNSIKSVEMTSFNSAGLGALYLPINPDGLPQGCTMIRITNASNTDVSISYDGITDHDYLLQNETLQLKAQEIALFPQKVCLIPRGTIIYLKGTAGAGNIYLSGYYE